MMRLLKPKRFACRAAACTIGVGLAVAGMVLAAPASATQVSAVSFAPTDSSAGASNPWTIGFTSTSALGQNSTIDVTFDSAVTPTTTVALGTAFGNAKCSLKGATVTQSTVRVTLAGGQCALPGGTAVSLQATATNPTIVGSYGPSTFTVLTSADTTAKAAGSAVTIGPAAASKLVFTLSPSASSQAGVAFATQPKVTIQDQYGNTASSTAAVTLGITDNTSGFSCTTNSVNAVSGVANFSGCKMTTAGTYTLSATSGTLTSATSSSFTITAAGASKLAFVQAPPANPFVNATISPAVTVQIQDTFGNAAPSSGVTVTIAATGGNLTGGSTTTNASGLATFSSLKFGSSALGITMSAASGSLTPVTSSTLNVTVNVNSGANGLTDTATDSAAGVGSVSYYYCSGWSGSCTSSSGTLIGSSSTSAGNFPVNWTSRPPTGAYRVVAVATDKVNNVSIASASTPVTVS